MDNKKDRIYWKRSVRKHRENGRVEERTVKMEVKLEDGVVGDDDDMDLGTDYSQR